jgi:hypothetical protein
VKPVLGTPNANILNTEPKVMGLQDTLTEGSIDDIIDRGIVMTMGS